MRLFKRASDFTSLLERRKLFPRGFIGTRLIRDDLLGYEGVILDQPGEEALGSARIAVVLQQNVEHLTVLIHRSP
jgi:hypothetical protein